MSGPLWLLVVTSFVSMGFVGQVAAASEVIPAHALDLMMIGLLHTLIWSSAAALYLS